MMKHLIFPILLSLFLGTMAWGQQTIFELDAYDDTVTKLVYAESPVRIQLEANASVRFESDASVYLRWEGVSGVSRYTVRYRKAESTGKWKEVVTSDPELTLHGLPLDTDYVWTVEGGSMTSGTGVFSTQPQQEPIQLSATLYDGLIDWFTQGEGQLPFCDFMEELDINLFEKLSFLQAYSFGNSPMVSAAYGSPMGEWYPREYTPFDCTGFSTAKNEKANCNCKVLTRGGVFAIPTMGNDDNNLTILPRVKQWQVEISNDDTFVDRFEAGAAKYIALRQSEPSGAMSFDMSNVQGAEADESVTTEASEIKFFLGCLTGTIDPFTSDVGDDIPRGFSTNLPKECDCERPIKFEYGYATNLLAHADKRWAPWSRGAAAQAEDMAFVVVTNQTTHETEVIDAGQAMVGKACNSTWNPDFWIELVGVAKEVLLYLGETQEGNPFPTEERVEAFAEELTELIGTPFSNTSGECGKKDVANVLVQGVNSTVLFPNEPIKISLFSAYYTRVRGFGAWRAAASVASDYYLVGVVESAKTEDEECCADKFSSYLVGSLSRPENGDVYNDAVNSIEDRLRQVGFFLAEFGSWNGLTTNPFTGQVEVKGEYGLLTGPSCEKSCMTHLINR
ncbi:MAG: hypothetical protein R2795_23965 [Saprospiraceae bacterium]